VVTKDFRIDVTTNRGKQDLLFKNQDQMEILVKLNSMGYLYGVEHISRETDAVSSLLELDPTADWPARKFIRYVGADEVNKWISLGRFAVEAPFGIERLQFIASSKDLADSLPLTTFDQASGYYLLSNDPAKSIITVRGLKPVISNETKSAEAILTFTTLP
jgi:hypothetical protein